MNKILRYSFVALMAMVGMGSAWAEDTFVFESGSFKADQLTTTINNVNWTLNATWVSEGYYGFDVNKGLQLGSGSKPATAFTISTSDITKKIQKIVVNCSGASQIAGTVNLTVGGTAIGSQYTLTTSATDAEFPATTALSGEIKINYAQTSSKAMYIKYIKVIYEGETETIPEVSSISAFKELGSGTKAVLNLTNFKVSYVSSDNKYVYVRDNADGMCFYNQSAFAGATNKWQLGGKIEGTVNIYNGLTQMNVTDASAMTHTDGAEYQPVAIASTDAASHIADLVKLTDEVTVFVDGNNFYTSEDKAIQIYDTFKLNYTLTAGDKITGLTGVIIPYSSKIEIAPTVIPTAGVAVLKADVDANAPAYNVAGQKVEAGYKGLVIKGGKKFVNK